MKLRSLLFSFALLLPALSSATALPGSQLTAYPALSPPEKACAVYWGGSTAEMYGQTGQPNFITPSTLGILCNLPPAKQTNEAFLTRLFVEFVDYHRVAISNRCPSDYDISFNNAPARSPFCAF